MDLLEGRYRWGYDMDKLMRCVRFLLSLIVFQLLAYGVVDTMNPLAYEGIPLNILGEDTGKIIMHIIFSLMALMVSITTYD